MTSPIPLAKSILQLTLTSALSGYGLFLSYQNITRLQQYEQQSEKAAEWSNTAAERLHKTRTTQTSGTISLIISILTPIVALSTSNSTYLVSAAAANTAVLMFSRQHMANFWNEKEQTRIPFVQKFNDAVRGSEQVVQILGLLGASWAVTAVGWGVMGQGWL
ncbi:hypothetical protein HBH53_115980 [Parastagonospora nodorum]|nr:hypothetical protein HBH53_115980 [Parastagonospora nodorum]KAH3972706.1 hypothetical protein HBH51_103150 [Parastagonospora nodorum]KAH4181397.1 hypothetical protein HBH42_238050 [Parastagonospora nodorum]KAH4962387.1 hypothetical protein HBI78_134700 [Parastagonospora nodorum]KAH5005039.1 hypothetical protein HBI75_230450 [Parastagonospora nodorum]